MLYRKFITLVEDHAETLTKDWIKEVKNNPATPGYANIPDDELHSRSYDVYVRLGRLLMEEDPNFKDQASHYMKLGKDRAAEGLKLSEVIYALILSRVVLWRYIVNQGIINGTLDLQQALEFYQKVTNYFDKAAYFVACGYENFEKKTKIKDEAFIDKTVKAVTKWFIKDIS